MTVMSSAAFAHTNATSQSRVDIAISPNLKGVVVDENKTPIDFVNVVLLKVDSTYLAGTVTDKDGTFAFKGIMTVHGSLKFLLSVMPHKPLTFL